MKYKFRVKHSPKELRQLQVEEITKQLTEAKSLVLFSSQFVTHQQFEELRAKLAPQNAKLQFVKNTLFKVAAEKKGLPTELIADTVLWGPTAAVFIDSEDFVNPIKTLKELFGKNENVKMKLGFLDKTVYGANQVLEFANIPSVEQLHAKLVGMLVSPLYGLHNALSYDMRRLAIGLQKIGEKGGDQ